MFENTARLQAMEENWKYWSHPNITKYVATFENTTRWQATGENLTYWSNQIRGNAWKYRTIPGHKIVSNGKTLNLLKTSDMWQCWKIAQCLKIPTKDVSHGNTTRFSATELSIFEGTTRLPATEKNLTYSIWSHQHGNVWKYHKIAGHGGTLKLLKHTQYLAISEDTPSLPPTVEYLNHWSLRIPQDCSPRGKIWVIEAPKYFAAAQYLAIFENTTRLSETDKTFYLLKPPNIWQCLKRPQDWRPRGGNLSYWSHPIFRHIWKYNKIVSHEEIFELWKTPNMWQCSRIPQDCRPRGKA